MFTILPEFKKVYHKQIELGKQYIADKTVIVTSLARNLENDLKENIASIDNLKAYCKDLHYFVYENDSSDSTPQILESLKKTIKNFEYRSEVLRLKIFSHKNAETKLELKSTERTQNLAKHRNLCLDYIRKSNLLLDFLI